MSKANNGGHAAVKAGMKREKFNPKPWIIGTAATAFVVAAVLIYAAVKTYMATPTFDYKGNSYYDKKNDITYVAAPMNFTYVIKAVDRYARSDGYDLYRVGYKDGDTVHLASKTEWLATGVENGGIIYYNPDKIDFPEASDFGWSKSYLCSATEVTIATHEFNKEQTDKLMSDFFAKDRVNRYADYEGGALGLKLLKELRVASDSYKCVYMVFTLYTDSEGRYYLASMTDKTVVETGASFLAEIFED